MLRTMNLLMWPFRPLTRAAARLFKRFAIRVELKIGGEEAKRRRDAQRLASGILSEFHRQGFTRRVVTGKRKARRARVRFEYPLLMTHDELWCPIDLRRLPAGVRSPELGEADVLQSIEDRIHAPVRIDYLANQKLCIVARLGGTRFPERFLINAFEMPPDAPTLAFPLGMNADGEHEVGDLIELKHLLVAGATGGGKTTFQHALISTLVARNTADDVELWLIDPKRTEFALYRPLLGTKGKPGIVRHIEVEPEKAIEILDQAFKEITRRNQLMERYGATNITDYEQSTGQRMKRIVLIVDEFAILTTDKNKIGKQTVGQWAQLLMTRIAALGRSAGVSIVVATQFVNKEVLSSPIRANFENRITFSCADWRQSQLVVESSEADGLPKGRAILRVEGKTKELQTCLISPRQVRLETGRIAEFGPDGGLGDQEENARFVKDAKILLVAACEQFAGEFVRAKLLALDGIRGVVSQERFNEIAQRLERDGVLDPGGPRKARRVALAFFNRPHMLDVLYGFTVGEAANRSPTVDMPHALQLEDETLQLGPPDAENSNSGPGEDTVYGLEFPSTCTPEPTEPAEPPAAPPDAFTGLFDQLDQPKPKKPKNPGDHEAKS